MKEGRSPGSGAAADRRPCPQNAGWLGVPGPGTRLCPRISLEARGQRLCTPVQKAEPPGWDKACLLMLARQRLLKPQVQPAPSSPHLLLWLDTRGDGERSWGLGRGKPATGRKSPGGQKAPRKPQQSGSFCSRRVHTCQAPSLGLATRWLLYCSPRLPGVPTAGPRHLARTTESPGELAPGPPRTLLLKHGGRHQGVRGWRGDPRWGPDHMCIPCSLTVIATD